MDNRTMIVTMISGSMFFLGVFILIQPFSTELSQKIGGDLIMITPIPYVVNWILSKSDDNKPKQNEVKHE